MTSDDLMKLSRQCSLASMFSAYPDSEFQTTLEALHAALAEHVGVGPMVRLVDVDEDHYDALRGRYLELFDRGKERISLYETEYGRMRGAGKGQALADIAGFYRAFGLSLQGDEMLDHVAVELEFYALLLAKQAELKRVGDGEGESIVEDAMRKFLTVHLGTFVDALAERVKARDELSYAPLFAWIADLIRAECARLEVQVDPLDYFEDEERTREPRCAHSLPVLQ